MARIARGLVRLRRVRDSMRQRILASEHVSMILVAVVIGSFGGLGAVGFRWLIKVVQRGAWGTWSYGLDAVAAHPWWWVLILPALGGLLVGPMVHFLAKEAKGHGVPEVMEAVALRSGFIRPRLVAVKSLASALTIGTGGSVGREGPIVQIGSALGSTLGQWLKVSGDRLKTFVGCGAAAGIAATFNAPIAGALFAVEIILGDFGVPQFSPIVISSVMATVVSRHFLGNHPAFVVPPHQLVSAWELVIYAVLGVVAAVVAVALIRSVSKAEDWFDSAPGPPWLLPVAGGLCVGAVALAFPQVLGVGYEAIDQALDGELALGVLAILVVAKLVATSVTLGSGGSGGVFAPSLFLGAMTGGALGGLAHHWFPTIAAGSGAYALVGMGAVVAGTTHAPITAILIIFELTSDYSLILPLMGACIIATVVASRMRKESIYTEKLLRRGVDLFRGRELNVLKTLTVGEVMSRDVHAVHEDEPLPAVVEQASRGEGEHLYVETDDGRYYGMVETHELREVLLRANVLEPLVVAGDLAQQIVEPLTPDENLGEVLRIFADSTPEELPVVDPESGRLVGTLARRHLLEAYNRELLKREMVSALATGMSAASHHRVRLGGDYRLVEIDVPGAFLDRSIRDLALRSRYNIQVVLVKTAPSGPHSDQHIEVVPDPDMVLHRGDRLVLMGREEDLAKLGRW